MLSKVCLVLLAPLFLNATSSGLKAGVKTVKATNCSFSPLYLDGGISYFSYEVKIVGKGALNVVIKITNDLYSSGKVISDLSYTKSGGATIVYDNSFTRSSNTISFIAKNIITGEVTEFSHEANPKNVSSLTLTNDNQVVSSTTSVFLYDSSNSWISLKEKIHFNNFTKKYIPDYYHKFNPHDLYLSVENVIEDDFYCGDITLNITNRNGIFNNVKHDKNLAEFPMILQKSDGFYYLAFKEKLYVNQTTLEMSSKKTSTNVETKYLYMPRNEMRYQNEYTFTLTFSKLGMDHKKVKFSFRFSALKNLIGDCHNSEFCVNVE